MRIGQAVTVRAKMPACAAFVDGLREAFGVEEVNSVIKRGLRPECAAEHRVVFSEAGYVLGSPAPEGGGVTAAQMVIGNPVSLPSKRGRT